MATTAVAALNSTYAINPTRTITMGVSSPYPATHGANLLITSYPLYAPTPPPNPTRGYAFYTS